MGCGNIGSTNLSILGVKRSDVGRRFHSGTGQKHTCWECIQSGPVLGGCVAGWGWIASCSPSASWSNTCKRERIVIELMTSDRKLRHPERARNEGSTISWIASFSPSASWSNTCQEIMLQGYLAYMKTHCPSLCLGL